MKDVEDVTLPPVTLGCGGETICPTNIDAEFWWANAGRTKAAALAGVPIDTRPTILGHYDLEIILCQI